MYPTTKLVRVTAKHFVAGIIFSLQQSTWIATASAPILYWMVQKHFTSERMKSYCKKKFWKIEVID